MDFVNLVASPFALLLRYLSEMLDSYGGALIVLGLIITMIRVPFDIKGKRGTMKTALLQPKMKEIQEKFAGNTMKINQEVQKLYREENVKPLGGCIWMVFPMIILLILFQIIRQPLTHLMGLDQAQIDTLRVTLEGLGVHVATGALYQVEMAGYIRPYFDSLHAAVPEIFNLNMNFLGMNIGEIPNWRVFFEEGSTARDYGLFMLPVVSMAAAFISSRLMMATNYMPQMPQQAQMMKTMMLMMPMMSLFIGFTFPGAMSLYWTVSSLAFAFASVFINRHFKKIFLGMKEEMEERERQKLAVIEAEREAKRKKTEELRALGATHENKGTSKKNKHLREREKERQRQAAQRATERESEEGDEEEEDPARVGHRRFARGRAYMPDRFGYEGEEGVDTDSDLDELDDEERELEALLEDGDLSETEDDIDESDDADYDADAEDDYDDSDDEDDDR